MFRDELANYGKGIHCFIATLKFSHGSQRGGGTSDPLHLTIGTRRQTFVEHNHEDIEVLAVLAGTLYVTIDGTEHVIREGEMVVINPFEHHVGMMEIADEQLIYHVLLMKPRFLIPPLQCSLGDRLTELLDGKFKIRTHITPADEICPQIFDAMSRMQTARRSAPSVTADCGQLSGAYAILGMLLTDHAEPTAAKTPRSLDFVKKVNTYIEENYNAPISTADICAALGYNLTHFCHIFREHFADSFTSYLCKYRVRRAATDYRESTLSVAEIAEAVGFGDYCHFSRSFKRHIGVPPSKYFRGK